MADVLQVKVNGVLVQQWDDNAPRTYTEWDLTGVLTIQRPYNSTENADADARALAALRLTNDGQITSKIPTIDMPAMQAILDQPAGTPPTRGELKDIARAIRRLDRKVLKLLDAQD